MKIALVYDHINKIGGAERILTVLHKLYPQAPLYTLVFDDKKPILDRNFKIITSFLQNFPFAKTHHEFFPVFPVFAFENFNFNEFDVVISITSAEAKCVNTNINTLHICYCLTPTRYLWSHYQDYFKNKFFKILSFPVILTLRIWDVISSQRPDIYLAISKTIELRIKKYYQRESTIIYPPVNLKKFYPLRQSLKATYFLIVSRLVAYKHIEIAINACNKLKIPLKIIGSGMEKSKLQKISGTTIEFIENLTDNDLIKYYQNCLALLFPGEEDFGIVMVEAQACGKPVIAYNAGGATEIIENGISGELFYPQTSEALGQKLINFKAEKYSIKNCQKQAEKFSQDNFVNKFSEFIKKEYNNFKRRTIV